MPFIEALIIAACIYVVLASSFNLILGFAGVMAFCQAAFYGLGAYVSTLLTLRLGWNLLASAIGGVAAAALLSLLVSWPSVRVRGVYFVIVSIGFQMIVYYAMLNGGDATGGAAGLRAIPKLPAPDGVDYGLTTTLYAAALAVVAVLFCWRIGASPFGRVLKGIREDEVACQSLGKNVALYKITAFAVCAGLAALAGVLYARYVRFISPDSFSVSETFFIFSILVIGGAGSIKGPIAGAAFGVLLPQALTFLPLQTDRAAALEQILFGVLVILVLRFRPQGVLGDYALVNAEAADRRKPPEEVDELPHVPRPQGAHA